MAVKPVTPNASPEAQALLNYIHAIYGRKTLSGQMWCPAGPDEIELVQQITGKLPAIRGQDFIDEHHNQREIELAQQWWEAGGIPTMMWHWGAPTMGDGYEQSKMTIDIDRCFDPVTAEYAAMWSDLHRIGDHLTKLRDAHVPILWRPMHEFDGGWFWWGKGGGERFIRLWRTIYDYLAKQRHLDNLIWVLCYCGDIKAGWDPGRDYYDLAGADTYATGIHAPMYARAKTLFGPSLPIMLHECGTLPDPDQCLRENVMWSWWMLWHTSHLYNHNREDLIRIYNHDLVITRDKLPRWSRQRAK